MIDILTIVGLIFFVTGVIALIIGWEYATVLSGLGFIFAVVALVVSAEE